MPEERDPTSEDLARAVRSANDGDWPTSTTQWRTACARLGFRLYLRNELMLSPGWLLGRNIVVQNGDDKVTLWCCICHELAEGLQLDDCPWRSEEDCHCQAVAVEREYRAWLTFWLRSKNEESTLVDP